MKPNFKKIAASMILSNDPSEITKKKLDKFEESIEDGSLTLWYPFENWIIENIIEYYKNIIVALEEAYNEGLKQKEI